MLVRNDYKKLCKQLDLYGFKSYKEFLASALWKEFRLVMYKKERPKRCSICHKKNDFFVLHHKTYKRILDPQCLVWICEDCHRKIHTEEIEKSVSANTDELLIRTNGKKQRVGSLHVIPSSGLPATLHHSINATGLVVRARNGECPIELLEEYKRKKEKKNDELMLNLLESNYDTALEYLATFTTN